MMRTSESGHQRIAPSIACARPHDSPPPRVCALRAGGPTRRSRQTLKMFQNGWPPSPAASQGNELMSVDTHVTTLSAAFDDYPHTLPLKRGEVASPRVA